MAYIKWQKRNGDDETSYEGRVHGELRYIVEYGPYIDQPSVSHVWSAFEVDGDAHGFVAQRDALHDAFAAAEVHYYAVLATLLKTVNDEAERRDLDPWLHNFDGLLKVQIDGQWFTIEDAARHLGIE
jgi:hypothetical protein